MRDLVQQLDDPETRCRVLAERAFLARLEGGCQVPIAGHATLVEGGLRLVGFVGTPDGARALSQEITGAVENAEALGELLADRLLAEGAAEILAAYKGEVGGSPRE